jgi:lipopolysaccharide biosynthesis protein
MNDITFFIHIYYQGSWEIISNKCAEVLGQARQIIITSCYDEVIREVGPPQERTTILKVPNKGKDIGGKLAGLSYYLHFGDRTSYFAFLHDKMSPQTLNIEYWFDNLFSIFETHRFGQALDLLQKHTDAGILGSKAFLKNEFIRHENKFDTTNNALLWQLIHEYGLKCDTYDFIAGTVFIGRSRILESFFTVHSPLDAREKLEKGNVLDLENGTYTHCWERLFSFIAENQGYKVIGI